MARQHAPQAQTSSRLAGLYGLVTGDEDARVCKDIPERACTDVPVNFFLHLVSTLATKIGDELASAKLVLVWLMTAVGAPTFLVGLLVPIRESGALVPQLVVARSIREFARRKWFWVVGSVLQGGAVSAMAVVALTLDGAVAGWLLVGALTVLSLARGVCSVAYKDVLGKTVPKTRRGTLMGYSAALAGLATVGVGVYAKLAPAGVRPELFYAGLLGVAAALWFLAAGLFAGLREQPGATEGGGNAIVEAVRSFGLLRTDVQFRHFVVTRALLLSTALALPFYVVLAREQTGGDVGALGQMIIASGLAGTLSAPAWGRLADRSARLVMGASALIAAVLGGVVFLLTGTDLTLAHSEYGFAVFFFLMGIAHAGARLGRKTYLVDMATAQTRAAYTALSNTVIGILILAGGAFGVLAQLIGARGVILLLAVMGVAAAASTWRLPEVES